MSDGRSGLSQPVAPVAALGEEDRAAVFRGWPRRSPPRWSPAFVFLDFLDLGGRRPLAGRGAPGREAARRPGVEVPPESLFQAPTVAAQASVILQSLTERIPEGQRDQLLGEAGAP